MQEAGNNNPLISDLESMFRYSGMIDQLRDTARALTETGDVSKQTLASMKSQYRELRQALKGTLAGKAAEEIERWAPDMSEESTVDGVYFAAAALARWIDLCHQTPKFLIAEELAGAAAVEMSAKAKAQIGSLEPSVTGRAAGTYL